MPSKFGGVAVTDEPSVSKFGGVPVEEPGKETPAKPGFGQYFMEGTGFPQMFTEREGFPSVKETLNMANPVSSPGPYERGSMLNLVHAIPGIGPPLARSASEIGSGEFSKGIGHGLGALTTAFLGSHGLTAPEASPVNLRSPVTVGEPRIPGPPAMAARYIPGAREVGNIASDVSRIRLRSPIAPWEPPTTPVTPVSPRFKGPIPEPEAPDAAPPAPIAKPTTPPFTSMTPNPPNLRGWLRGGPETIQGRNPAAWRGLPEPTTPAAPPTTAIPATKTISGRTPGTGPDPFVGPTRPLEPASPAPARVTPISERPNTITSPETAPAVDVHPAEASNRASLGRKMGEQLFKAKVPVEQLAELPDDASFWKTLENKARPNETATRSEPPSPETIQLAKEHHARLMGQQAPLAKPFVPGSSLTGRSLDIAQQLKSEMGGTPSAEPATLAPRQQPSALPQEKTTALPAKPNPVILGRNEPATSRPAEGSPILESSRPGNSQADGESTTVRTPGGERSLEARYTLRELEDVRASHNAHNFEPNPKYELVNDRDYGQPEASARVIRQSGKDFAPEYLINDNPDATNGPPVIDKNGNVLGGNSRTMTLGRVYAGNPEGATAYRALLAKKAAQFGIDPKQIDTMRQPVLVRQVTREMDPTGAARSVTDLNKVPTAALRPAERAIADSKGLSHRTLDYLAARVEEQGPEGTLANALEGGGGPAIVNRLVDDGIITAEERPQYIDERGTLTAEGKSRVSDLLVGRLFDSPDMLENTPPAMRGKLERIVAPLARVQARPEWDLTPAVKEALGALQEARAHGLKNLDDLVRQNSMFGGVREISPEALQLAKHIKETGGVALAKQFRQYAQDEIMSRPGQPATFHEPPSRETAFSDAFGKPKQ